MLTSATINAGSVRARVVDRSARIDTIDLVLFMASCTVCAFFFFQGGVAGLIAAPVGFAASALRSGQPAARWRNAFRAAFAALWAGMMVGGMLAFAL